MKMTGDGRFAWLLVFGVAYLLTLALAGWTIADGPLVDDNPLLFSAQANTPQKWGLLLAPHADLYWRPVAKLTLVPAALVAGYATWPHRLTALLLHALVTTLLWVLARRLYDLRSAYWTAAVFLLHPIHAGTIYWISARYDLVAAAFATAAVVAALPAAAGATRARNRWAAAIFTLLACLSKEIAFITPGLIAVTVWLQSDGARREKAALAWRQTAGSLIAVALVLLARLALLHRLGGPEPLSHPEPTTILGNLLISIPLALFAPINWEAVTAGSAWSIGLGWLALGITALVLFAARRRERRLWLGPLWIAIAALPLAGFIFLGRSLNAGYMLYLPSAGLALWLGPLLAWPDERSKKPRRLARRLLQFALCLYCVAGLTLNLQAYHRAERLLGQITGLVRNYAAQNPARNILVEDLPQEVAGLPLFYDHFDQFFLPDPESAERRFLLVGPRFYRTEGAALPWSDPAWIADTAVIRWQGNRQGMTAVSPQDLTAPTREKWRRRGDRPNGSLALAIGPEPPAGLTRTPAGLEWRRGPVSLPLLAAGADHVAARIDVGDTGEVVLTFAIEKLDRRAAPELRFEWTDQDDEPHAVLLPVNADGRPHTYRLALAADPRWARTLFAHGLVLHLPWRAGRLRF
ncbi:MAG: hypothetical protein GX444_15985 [Myxococcales bacterium]|nr:hypothetical protein [Myxococcales bacterium]